MKSKAFTIIELLVVVAIIAVLATIIVVGVSKYITKGKDAAIKAEMNSLVTVGAKYFETYGNYYTDDSIYFCANSIGEYDDADPEYLKIKTAIDNLISNPEPQQDLQCISMTIADSWVAAARLSTKTSGVYDLWCVDSSGSKRLLAGYGSFFESYYWGENGGSALTCNDF